MRTGHRRAHRVLAFGMAIAIVAILAAAFALRQDPANLPPPVQLSTDQEAALEAEPATLHAAEAPGETAR